LMWLRLYLFFRVISLNSTIYQRRKVIQRIPGYTHCTHPTFNTFLSWKMIFYVHPILFIAGSLLSSWLVLAYTVYVFERELQPASFTYGISFYIIMNSLLTSWGDDTFDIYTPVTWPAKIICIFSVVLGVFWFALLIDYVHTTMQPTRFQLVALDWVRMSQTIEKERANAAKLIQLVWRHQGWKKMAKQEKLSKPLKRQECDSFTVKYLQLVKQARRLRREKLGILQQEQKNTHQQQLVQQVIRELKTDLLLELKRQYDADKITNRATAGITKLEEPSQQ